MDKTVTVIGAGIVGVCCALHLQREGFKVRLIKKGVPGKAASFGNSGSFGIASCVPFGMPGILKKVPRMLFDTESPLKLRWSHVPKALPWFLRFIAASRKSRVEAITAAGGKVVRPLDETTVTLFGAPRIYRYLQGVGAVTDGVRGLHTHSPVPMERILEAGEVPDLVFADHGFAGAAVARGIPAIAVMDTNDTALAVARARGRDLTLIPLDDGRRPDAYDVIAEMFQWELAQGR